MLDFCCTNHPGIPIQQLVAVVVYTWDNMPLFVPEVKEQLTAQEPTPSTQASSTQAVAKGNGKGKARKKEKPFQEPQKLKQEPQQEKPQQEPQEQKEKPQEEQQPQEFYEEKALQELRKLQKKEA